MIALLTASLTGNVRTILLFGWHLASKRELLLPRLPPQRNPRGMRKPFDTLVGPFGTLCVGTSYHASFWSVCDVCSGCVLGHLIVNNDVHFTLYYHDVVVVMSCNFHSCLLYVSHARIDPVGSHAPHHLVSKLALSPPPPPAPLCSEALPVALQGRDWRKCDLRHAGRHAGRGRVTPAADRPPGACWKESAQVIGPRE